MNQKRAVKFSSLFLFLLILFTNSSVYATSSFRDLPNNHWARGEILQLSQKGYISGYEDNTFRPSGEITRAEFVSILTRILQLPGDDYPFNDKHVSPWANKAIGGAVKKGIILPNEYGVNFDPKTPITRIEMAKMSARALHYVNAEYDSIMNGLEDTIIPIIDFKDLKSSEIPFVAVVHGTGLIKGYPNHAFGIKGKATRAEATAILNRFYRMKDETINKYQALQEYVEIAQTGSNIESVTGRDLRSLKENDYSFNYYNAWSVDVKRIIAFDLSDPNSTFRPMFENTIQVDAIKGKVFSFGVELEVNSDRQLDPFFISSNVFVGSGGGFALDFNDAKRFNYELFRNMNVIPKGKTSAWHLGGVDKNFKENDSSFAIRMNNASPHIKYLGQWWDDK